MSFLREVFSENNQGSFSRVAAGFHSATAMICILHVLWHTHVPPDAATMAGLAGFAVAPYGASKISGAISNWGANNGGGAPPAQPSSDPNNPPPPSNNGTSNGPPNTGPGINTPIGQ
jgi:hypothetical protein